MIGARLPPAISALSEALRRRTGPQIVLPLAVALLGAIGLTGFATYWATSHSDIVSVERQVRVVRHAIDNSIDDLALQQETVAVWDESAANLARPELDQVWLRDNISLWLHNIFGHDEVFILDGRDRPIHALTGSQIVPVGRYRELEGDVRPLVESARGRVPGPNGRHDRNPGRALSPSSTVLTTGRTWHDSHLVLVEGRPAAVSAMLIKESTPGYVKLKGPPPVLVSVRYLDGNFLVRLGERNLIEDPRFSRTGALRPGEHRTLLRGDKGDLIGYLVWKPELPGSAILDVLAPLTASLAVFMCALTALLARRLLRTTSDLAAAEAAATELALRDALTGLPNRVLLSQRLAACADGRPALMLIDLDRFKQVNDTLGHQAGDGLLIEFGERLAALVGARDTVARLGGDEFAVLTHGPVERLESLCQAILDAAARPFGAPGGTVFVGASIGIAVSEGGCDAAELTRRADLALYAAKEDGRGCARFFTADMDAVVRERAVVEAELRLALADGELAVWYQPQVAADGRTVGLEALLRWQHPVRGAVPPERFIKVAEDTGLIVEIGERVLSEAAALSASQPELFVAVNVSPAQFRTSTFAERAVEIVEAAGADPRRLELEVTERLLLDANDTVLRQIERLRVAGFRLALDDFGTGYSSLSYLQRFRVDKIKIDRSFVGQLPGSADGRAIVVAIANLGRALGLTVTAEGVETREQFDLLLAAGCDQFQGYLFAQPQPKETEECCQRESQSRAVRLPGKVSEPVAA